jgi:hypothetical protein
MENDDDKDAGDDVDYCNVGFTTLLHILIGHTHTTDVSALFVWLGLVASAGLFGEKSTAG